MLGVIKHQIKFLLKRTGSIIAFSVLLLLVLINFITNIIDFSGLDILDMYHPMSFLVLSFNKTLYNPGFFTYTMLLFPLLVNLPAGLSYAAEKDADAMIVISKLGKKNYIFSRLISVFITTAIVFTVPFLIEIVLNCISFPLAASGDLSQLNAYDPQYIEMTHGYLLSGLYYASRYVHAIVFTVVYGLFAGVIACFTFSISVVFSMKLRVLYILPVFILLQVSYFTEEADTKWYNFVTIACSHTRYFSIFAAAVALCIVLTIVFTVIGAKKETV